MEQALISYDYLRNDTSKEYAFSSLDNLAKLRLILGEYNKAKDILEETTVYFKSKMEKMPSKKGQYLYTLNILTRVNSALGLFSENEKIFNSVKSDLQLPQFSNFVPVYLNSEGFQYYKKNDFENAIKKYKEALSQYKDEDLHLEEKFYLGMSYWKLNKNEEALSYFQEIDHDYDETGRISMEFRPMFEFFIDYYKNKGDQKNQLVYVEKLLQYDRNFAQEQKNLSYKINTDYDEKRLLEEKAKIENSRKTERWVIIAAAILTLAGSVSWLFFVRKKNKSSEKYPDPVTENNHSEEINVQTDTVSETIILEQESLEKTLPVSASEISETFQENNNADVKNSVQEEEIKQQEEEDDVAYIPYPEIKVKPVGYDAYAPINESTVKHILNKLENFESKKKFLKKNLRLSDLALEFNTNDKYLARVIKVKTGKIFNYYVNDLRFAHLEKLIKEDASVKQKKIKEISAYLGYSSPEAFTNLFRERFGVSPTQYFKEDSNFL